MAVPKKKSSKSRGGKRRSNIALKTMNITFDSVTGEPKMSHHVSPDGYYNGKLFLPKKVKATKQEEIENQ